MSVKSLTREKRVKPVRGDGLIRRGSRSALKEIESIRAGGRSLTGKNIGRRAQYVQPRQAIPVPENPVVPCVKYGGKVCPRVSETERSRRPRPRVPDVVPECHVFPAATQLSPSKHTKLRSLLLQNSTSDRYVELL